MTSWSAIGLAYRPRSPAVGVTGRAAHAMDLIEGADLTTTTGRRRAPRSVCVADGWRRVTVPRKPDLDTIDTGWASTWTLGGGLIWQAGVAVAVSTVVRLQRVEQLGHDRWILCG